MFNRCLSALGIAVALSTCSALALAQQPRESGSIPAAISPPVNHESGVIEEVLSAEDAGYRFCAYSVRWRETPIFLSCASQSRQRGDTVDFTVYRTSLDGHRTLRFVTSQDDWSASTEEAESEDSRASITAGKAVVQQVLIAENEGYRSVAYEVIWHGSQVIVVDPNAASAHMRGDSINFKVLRTEKNRELSFSLDE